MLRALKPGGFAIVGSFGPQGPEHLLVDGYNVIFAWDSLREIAEGNLDAARLNLLFGREVVAADKDFDPLSYEAMLVIDERVARQSFPESFEDVFEV